MKRSISSLSTVILLGGLAIAGLVSSCKAKGPGELVVYCYDSFASEWGTGPAVIPAFEKRYGVKVKLVPKGDAGATLAAVVAEKGKHGADVILGIDQNLLHLAKKRDVLAKYRADDVEASRSDLVSMADGWATPFDYGYFAIIFDTKAIFAPPSSLEDLKRPDLSKKLILMDPRTSSPGYGFLSWTLSAYGQDWRKYWKDLQPSILTVAPGWDSGYGAFTQGEAPLVLSYTTSPAYHVEVEKTERYQALAFEQGHPIQVEFAALVKGAPSRKLAEKFLDFIASKEFQEKIALTNYMYPARTDLALPESFMKLPAVKDIPPPSQDDLATALDQWADVASAR